MQLTNREKAYVTKQMLLVAENQSSEEVVELIEKKRLYREQLMQQMRDNQNRRSAMAEDERNRSRSPEEAVITNSNKGVRRLRKALRPPGSAVESPNRVFPGSAIKRQQERSLDAFKQRSKSPLEDQSIRLSIDQINVETQTDPKITSKGVPIYKQTEAFLEHQKNLPPFPRSYSNHPVNELNMQVQGSCCLISEHRPAARARRTSHG